jgi:hypothetical protein
LNISNFIRHWFSADGILMPPQRPMQKRWLQLKPSMKKITFLFFAILYHLCIYGQTLTPFQPTVLNPNNVPNIDNMKYTVDPSIKDSVITNERNDGVASYQLMTMGRKKESKENGQNSFFAFVSYASQDTANIIIIPEQSASAGFRIIIIGDSCKIFHFYLGYDNTKSSGFLKLNEADTVYKNEILVPATFCKLTLEKKPDFKMGETIGGYIEFESRPYYVKREGVNGSKMRDFQMQFYIEGYFQTFDTKKIKH